MTAASPHRSGSQNRFHRQGWLISVLLHGIIFLAVALGVQRIQLAPQEPPFKWNVALVSPPQTVAPAAPPQSHTPAQPAPSTPPEHATQTAPAQQHPAPQPPVQQPTPSLSERTPPPVITEHPAPPQQTTPLQTTAHPAPPTEPVKAEPLAPLIADAPPVEKPADTPTPASPKATVQTAPPHVPPPVSEQPAQPDTTPPPTQTAALSTAPAATQTKRDYGWLSEAILRRVEELKRYPAAARLERAEGKVIVKAVINEDGSVGEVEIFQSSGSPSLDKAAIETIRQAAPFHLPHPLERPRLTVKIPISYRLDR